MPAAAYIFLCVRRDRASAGTQSLFRARRTSTTAANRGRVAPPSGTFLGGGVQWGGGEPGGRVQVGVGVGVEGGVGVVVGRGVGVGGGGLGVE